MICPACNSKYEESLKFCPKDGAELVPDDAPTQSRVGQILAERYRIVKLIGEGGMGEVYEAEHIYIKKKVALKLLRSEITSNAEAVTRFHQEALAASTIGHENIVNIDDFGRLPDGSVYLTMEYLDGQPLSDVMLNGRLAPVRALDIIVQMCEGLAAAHSKGIIHRDMKPENVYLVAAKDGTEQAKILDFGIAKVTSADSGENLTRTGTIFGTPHYMSPEQAMGRHIDHRTDIYSVGVIMYELFTGTVPFKAESFMGILTQHITALPQPPHVCAPDREIHPEIERIIMTAMAKEPDKRYPSMVEMLDDLRRVKQTVTGMDPAIQGAAAGPGGGWGTTAGTQARPVVQPTGPAMTPVPRPGPTISPLAQGGPGAPGMAPLGAPTNAPPGAPPPTTAMPTVNPMAATAPAQSFGSTSLAPGHITVSKPEGGAGKIVLILVIVLLLLGGGGAAAYFLVLNKGAEEDEGGVRAAEASDGMGADAMGAGGMGADVMGADAMGADAMGAGGMDTDAMGAGAMGAGAMGAGGMGAGAMDTDAMGAGGMGADGMDTEAMGADARRAAPPRAAPTVIHIRTTPRGARVVRDGETVCARTPCGVSVAAGARRSYTLTKTGYQDKVITVSATGPHRVSYSLRRSRGITLPRRVEPMVIHARRHHYRPPPHRRRRRPSADPFSEGID